MLTTEERTFVTTRYLETRSPLTVRREFHRRVCLALLKTIIGEQFKREPPTDETIRRSAVKFLHTGSVHDRSRSGRPSVVGDHADAVSNLLVQGASVRTAASVEGKNH